MSQEKRAELIEVIAELARRYPNWRFGQLVANVAGWADQEVWDVEDEQLLQAGRLHLEQISCDEVANATFPSPPPQENKSLAETGRAGERGQR